MSEINEQLNSLFDSMSEEEEVELSEELGIERVVDEDVDPKKYHKQLDADSDFYKSQRRQFKRDQKAGKKIEYRIDPARDAKKKEVKEDHIQATADRLGKFISSEDKKVRRDIDGYNSLTEEEKRDRKIQLLENEVTKIAQMTRAHFPGEGGRDLVSGIGQGGDGQTPGSGAVWLWDLDDVSIGTPLNGEYPPVGNGSVLVYNSVLEKWVAGAGGSGGTINTAQLQLANPVTDENVDVGDLPAPGTLTTQQGVNQWIAQSLLYIDGKISGGTDNDMEFDGDIEFISNQTQSLIKYNGGKLDIKVSDTDLASAVIVGEFTTAGLTLPSKTLAAQAVNATTGTFGGAVTIHTLTTGAEAGVAINAAAGQVTAQWMNVGTNPETDDTDSNYGVSIRTSGITISPETNVTTLSGARQGLVYKLVAGDGIAFDGQASTHIGGTVGNDYTTNTGTLKVNATVIRTTGDQQITGVTTLQNALNVNVKAIPFTDDYNSLKIQGYVDSGKTDTLLKTYIRASASTQQDYIEYYGATSGDNMIVNRAAVQTMIDNGGGSGLNFKGTINLTTDNAPANPNGGDLYINDTAGTVKADADPAWTGIAGDTCSAGQQVIYNASASAWVLGVVEDDSSYVKVDGSNDMTGALIIDIPSSTTDPVAFNIEKNNVDKITLNTTGTGSFQGAVTAAGLLPQSNANDIGAQDNRWDQVNCAIVDASGSLTVAGPATFNSVNPNTPGTSNIGTTTLRWGNVYGTTVNATNITSNDGTVTVGTNAKYSTINLVGDITIDTGAVNAADPPAGVPVFTKKRPTQEGYHDFIIEGTTAAAPTDSTGQLLAVFRNDYENTNEPDAVNYKGRTDGADNIQTLTSVQALIGSGGNNLTSGGVINAEGGSTDTSGNLTIQATQGSSTDGRLYIQQEAGDGQGGTTFVTNTTLNPSGTIQMGNTLTLGSAANLTGSKAYRHIITNSGNVAFSAGADTESGNQVTFLNYKNNSTTSARVLYANARFAVGDSTGASAFSINDSALYIDGYDTSGANQGDITYPNATNIKSIHLGGVNAGRAFRIKTGGAADAGNVVFRPNEAGAAGTTSSANYLGMNIRMFAAGNTSESSTPTIKLTGADGSIVATEYDFVGNGVFKTPYGFKLLNGSGQTEAITLDSSQNLAINVQAGPKIIGSRLTFDTSNNSTGEVNFYATGQANKNYFNFQSGENVGGPTGSVSLMELERDTSLGTDGQILMTLAGGIVMTGQGATTNNNATRTANAITFNNGSLNGVGMIHKIGNTGSDGNYVHIAGKSNAAGTNDALSGKYTVVKIGRDSSNKMDAQFAWNDTTSGVTPSDKTIWNQKVAQSFGVVTSLSATYGATASDANNYQFNAVTSWNRPIADDANGTGFEIKGATAAAPTNTSAKLVEVYHDVNSAGTGDSLNYYGKTSAADNVQTQTSCDARYARLGASTNTFSGDMAFSDTQPRFDFNSASQTVFSSNPSSGGSTFYFLTNSDDGQYHGTLVLGAQASYAFRDWSFSENVSFNKLPTCSVTPTSNNQLVNKSYVDSHSNSVSGGQTSGTFTLTFDGTGTVPSTKVTTTAHYVKTGKMVFIHFTAENLNFTGYAGGGIRMTGLPYAPDTNVGEQVGTIHSVNFKVNNYHADDGHVVVVNKDATYGNFLQILSEQVPQETTYITNTTASKIRVSINYITSD